MKITNPKVNSFRKQTILQGALKKVLMIKKTNKIYLIINFKLINTFVFVYSNPIQHTFKVEVKLYVCPAKAWSD